MRRLILALVLILSFCFALGISAVARETVTINETNLSLNNSENAESESNNATEVDGVRFEILAPERTWIIPENKEGNEKPIQLGFRLTNLQKKALWFPIVDPILLAFDSTGNMQHIGKTIGILGGASQLFCKYLSPGESIVYFQDIKLTWHNNKLYLTGFDGIGGRWEWDNIRAGSYEIGWVYEAGFSFLFCLRPENRSTSINIQEELINYWKTSVQTPLIKVQINPR